MMKYRDLAFIITFCRRGEYPVTTVARSADAAVAVIADNLCPHTYSGPPCTDAIKDATIAIEAVTEGEVTDVVVQQGDVRFFVIRSLLVEHSE